jgi:hypothetical protein
MQMYMKRRVVLNIQHTGNEESQSSRNVVKVLDDDQNVNEQKPTLQNLQQTETASLQNPIHGIAESHGVAESEEYDPFHHIAHRHAPPSMVEHHEEQVWTWTYFFHTMCGIGLLT